MLDILDRACCVVGRNGQRAPDARRKGGKGCRSTGSGSDLFQKIAARVHFSTVVQVKLRGAMQRNLGLIAGVFGWVRRWIRGIAATASAESDDQSQHQSRAQ